MQLGYAKTPLMEQIFLEASLLSPDWSDIANRVRHSQHEGVIGEAIMRSNLERACAQYQDRIIFDPIADGAQTASFSLRYNDHGAMLNLGKENYLQMDTLMEIDELPIIVEVKLSHKKKNERTRRCNPSGANDALKDFRYQKMSDFVHLFFGREKFGYAVVLYPEMIVERSGTQRNFREQNGILIPFYASREQYQSDLERMKPKILH